MSARSTISVFACGMSIPDSMIVVETSTSASPRRNACIFSSSSFSRICPCATRMRSSGAELRELLGPLLDRSRRGCGGRSSALPAPSRASSASRTVSSSYSPTVVRIGRRPSGGVSMIEMSRMPASERWSVRGIGVAESVSTSTSRRSDFSSSFWATPKRCSSSRTTSPSSFGITSRLSTRCVPIRTSTFPSEKSSEGLLDLLRRDEARDHLDAEREVAEAARGTCSSAARRGSSSARASAPACR